MRVLIRCCSFAVLAFVVACSSDGGVIDQVKLVNDTVYDLEVRATDQARDGWVPLGRARSGETSTHYHVTDLGGVWIFRFEYPGRTTGAELRVTRDDLAADGWTVRVPDDVERTLQREGIEPSAGG